MHALIPGRPEESYMGHFQFLNGSRNLTLTPEQTADDSGAFRFPPTEAYQVQAFWELTDSEYG